MQRRKISQEVGKRALEAISGLISSLLETEDRMSLGLKLCSLTLTRGYAQNKIIIVDIFI